MAKNIAMPDGSVVEFPDTMSDDDIGAAIKKNSAPSPDQTVNAAVASVSRPSNPILKAPEESGLETGPLVSSNPAENDTLSHGAGSARALAREVNSAGQAVTGIPAGLYHAFTDPATPEELQQAGGDPKEVQGAKHVGLGIQRLTTQPIADAASWYANAARGKVPDALNQALNVAPEALGNAAGNTILGHLIGAATGKAKTAISPPKPTGDVTSGQYSTPGDHIAASLRPNVRIDVPAEANNAHAALKEGLADRGFSTNDFQGRNGPQVLQSGIDNALRIQEARAKQVIDPIRNEPVDPQVLAQNPELSSRFKPGQKLTYGDLDNERVQMNKELRRGNFYTKDPTAQAAVADPMETTQEAVNQARDLVYGKAQETTGIDLRPLKQTESSLLKLADVTNTTKNGLSAREAKFQAASPLSKAVQSAKGIIALKSNPISAFSAYEKPGLRSPLADFNSNMQKAFPRLEPSTANTKVTLPKYNLKLTSPEGQTPSPVFQRSLFGSGAQGMGDVHEVPGAPNLQLTHPEGTTPSPIFQRMLLNATHGMGDAHEVPGPPDVPLTPSGDMPPALQRVLPLQNPGIPSEAYPGLHAPKKGK